MTERDDGGVLVLAVDTSSAAISTGVARVGAGVHMLAERTEVGPSRHAEVLTPAIAEVFEQLGITAADLSAVVAGDGPGPYTGLRVGLASAAAYADAGDIPAYGVCSLDAIAGPAAARTSGSVLVAADARRREIYWAVYADGRAVTDPAVDTPAAVAEWLLKGNGNDVAAMTGAGAQLYADVLGLPLLDQSYPDLAALVAGATDRIRTGAPGELLQPRYLRHPDATPPGARKAVTRA